MWTETQTKARREDAAREGEAEEHTREAAPGSDALGTGVALWNEGDA